MKTFDELWKFATRHGEIVQEKSELEHVFNLIQGCSSYLEIGTAEGNSLYVLSHALMEYAQITYVDLAEAHTLAQREECLAEIPNPIMAVHGDSHDLKCINLALCNGPYDVVFIDAGHAYEDVILDAVIYGQMARKFIIFHDVQLAPVNKAFEHYIRATDAKNVTKFIHSEHFGYGILEIEK